VGSAAEVGEGRGIAAGGGSMGFVWPKGVDMVPPGAMQRPNP
jgi:hypothetical protein